MESDKQQAGKEDPDCITLGATAYSMFIVFGSDLNVQAVCGSVFLVLAGKCSRCIFLCAARQKVFSLEENRRLCPDFLYVQA